MRAARRQPASARTERLLVAGAAFLGVLALGVWLLATEVRDTEARVPVEDPGERAASQASSKPRNRGTLVPGSAKASSLPGSWPQFRGADRTNIAHEVEGLARSWPAEGLQVLWKIPVGEGFAGAAVHHGCVYLIDYDQKKKEDAIRCLSLANGEEIWRYAYYVKVDRSHGMSRTTPAVNDGFVVTLGPKCHVTCVEAKTGKHVWTKDLVKDYGTTVPGWYAGQCPLIDGDVAVLAPGGPTLLMAVELATGTIRWTTPNPSPDEWFMSHSSVAAFEAGGVRQYVYCPAAGVVGVSAETGTLLWRKDDWEVKTSAMPTPVVVPPDRLFISGGYEAGCTLLRVRKVGEQFETEELFRLGHETFDSPQQTPILYQDHLYSVATLGQADDRAELACLDLQGKRLWHSGAGRRFGLGAYLMADGLLLVLGGARNPRECILHLVEATPDGYRELAAAKVLDGHEAWGPIALAGDRLIVRDLTTMVCLRLPKAP